MSILSPAPSFQVTLPYGNCFELAARYLGDVTQVDRIMRMNPQLNGDPWFVGATTITIPRVQPKSGNGGIIGL